ncbi:MAG: hypothetical protein Q9166_005923 [cf. Caloplaca sp. 2 TL-2023]
MSSLVSLLVLHLAVANQITQQPLPDPFPGNWEPRLDSEYCTVSHLTAFEQSKSAVEFSTSGNDNLDSPRLSAVNATAWEQWEFDSVSDTGLAGIMMGFSRDASYAFFGQGNLRVEFYIVLGDGSVVQELDYVSDSIIEDCENFVKGTWKGPGRTYSFAVTRDMKHAKLDFDSSNVKGNFTLTAAAPPHLPNGDLFPSKSPKSTHLAPKLYMAQPIPGGHIKADLKIHKKTVRFEGMGGHVRIWAEDGWFNICDGWHFLRAMAGPYVISYWQPVSRIDASKSSYSAQLFKNGEKLVGTQRGNQVSKSEDYVLFRDELDGEVTGALADRSSGHVIEFVSPKREKTWRFRVQHLKKQFEMGLGGDSGLTGFTNRVTGGEVGGTQYEGRALSEQVLLPKVIAQWRIWIVFGIGMLNRGKSFLTRVVGYVA